MTYYEELKANELEFYHELAREINPQGYRCFLYNEDTSAWLYILTPNNSLLCLDNADYGGYNITFEYVPSKDFGSGCRCNTNALYEVTTKELEEAEQYGRRFTLGGWEREYGRRVKIAKSPRYFEDAYKALTERWCYDKLIEVR